MNKLAVILLSVLLISAASANYLTKNLLLDNGEDHGESDSEDHFQKGDWNNYVEGDKGAKSDSGEYYSRINIWDNGEYIVNGEYSRYTYTAVFDPIRGDYLTDRLIDQGEYQNSGYLTPAQMGQELPEELFLPTFVKKAKKQE